MYIYRRSNQMNITTENLIQVALATNFKSKEMASAFGYKETNSFFRQIKRKTGKSFTQMIDIASKKGDEYIEEETQETKKLLEEQCKINGVDPEHVPYYWAKSKTVSMFVKRPEGPDMNKILEDFKKEAKLYSPVYKRATYKNGEHCIVMAPHDLHIGKKAIASLHGVDYNNKTAVDKTRKGVSNLIKTASMMGIDSIVLSMGHDALHVDNSANTTTRGTRQDATGMWDENFRDAKHLYIAVIEELALYAKVNLIYSPGNHDEHLGLALVDTIGSWFHNHDGVSTGYNDKSINSDHRKYIQYGNNLLGFTHGDKAKGLKLGSLMAHEQAKAWAESQYRMWFLGHLHHKIAEAYTPFGIVKGEKDEIGCSIIRPSTPIDPKMMVGAETIRSASPADKWHHDEGYISDAAIECFAIHPTRGKVANFIDYV